MSDPVTNVEIEDVLESIRRLVAAGEPAGPVPSQRAPHRPDRLVLTPALRVDGTSPPPDDGAALEHDLTPEEGQSADATDIHAEETDDEDASEHQEAHDQTEAEIDSLLARAMATTLPLAAAPQGQAEEPHDAEDDASIDWEDVEAEPRQTPYRLVVLAAPEAEDEPSETDEVLEPEDEARDLDVEEDQEDDEAETLWHSTRSDPADAAEDADVEPQMPEPEPEHPADSIAPRMTPADEATRRSSLEATIAELEAAVTFSDQDFEADDPASGLSAHSSGRLHLVVTGDLDPDTAFDAEETPAPPEPSPEDAPAPEAAADAPPSPATTAPRFRVYPGSAPERDAETQPRPQDTHIAARPDLDDDADLAAYLEDESVIDEEALRELVGQIVREELQGVLGERITRNVRKLVRREIHRILSSQDFD